MNLRFCPAVIALLSLSAFSANAETLVNESFDYREGSLYGNGKWIKYGAKFSAPVQVTGSSLQFPGYQEQPVGKTAGLTKESGECVQVLFRDKGTEPVDGAIYYAALINVSELPSGSKTTAFICLTGANALDSEQFGDEIAGSEGGGLFAQAAGDGFNLGVSRNVVNMGNTKTAVSWSAEEYRLNTTYLAVVKYEPAAGDTNDRISLWVNPDKESEAVVTVTADEDASVAESLANIRGIELRQGSSMLAKIPCVGIDGLRVATSWAEIFNPAGAETPITPEFTLSEMTFDFGKSYQGVAKKRTVNVKGKNLTGDISVSGMSSGAVSTGGVLSIPKEAAESADGYDLEITLNPNNSSKYDDNIIFNSPGAQSRKLSCLWQPIRTIAVSSIKELYDEDVSNMETVYLYTGEATVTCIDTDFFTFYAQDATGGAEFRSATGCGYDEIDLSGIQEGDNVTNIVGNIIYSDDGGIDFVPVAPDAWETASTGNTVTPAVWTFEQIHNASPYEVMFRLVTVEGISFDPKYADRPDFYDKFNSPYHIVSDNTLGGWLWYLHGTDIYNKPTAGYFTDKWDVTGICYYMAPTPAIAPRRLSDFKKHDEGAIGSIDSEKDVVTSTYDLYGRKVENPENGIFIQTMSDGSVRKAVIGNR